MTNFHTLLQSRTPLLLPGAHDALSARMIEAAGFSAYGVGGAALSAVQLGLPDVGLQSFGEYREAVGRILEASTLPVMIDGENGFGDVKAVTRTVRRFERMGVGGLAFEDLVFPPPLGRPPAVIARAEMVAKLEAALAARNDEALFIVGRTDAAHAVSEDEAILRARLYQATGVDAVLATGLANLAAYQRLRDAVTVPIVAVVVPGSPWFAPTLADLTRVGIEAALYPAALLSRLLPAISDGLNAIRDADGAPPSGFDLRSIGEVLKTADWLEVDRRFAVDKGKSNP